jgi:diacylglycerol O-acyltransferase / wax synthase
MPPARLSPLDASFLAAETPTAHMHLGWAAAFEPPCDGAAPTFEQLREHIAARLERAPRYRQRLATVPFGMHSPEWVDDEAFDVDNHVLRANARDLCGMVDLAMSSQLERSRPLWEVWISERLDDGRIGVVGKVHHCMVDGLAAVELGALLLDAEPDPEPVRPSPWQPEPAPGWLSRLARGTAARARRDAAMLALPVEIVRSPRRRVAELAGDCRRAAFALGHLLAPPAPTSLLNKPSSPLRHLGTVSRPLDDLRMIKQRHGTTINDVVLAVSAGGVRRFLQRRDEPVLRLKALVPVSVRPRGGAAELGNRISFVVVELPCDEPDPVRRLKAINAATTQRKRSGAPEGAGVMLGLVGHSPNWFQNLGARMLAGSHACNLIVSNVPGPSEPLYMRGCRFAEAYPIVPLAEHQAVSIGVTTLGDRACFGLYADRKSLPEVDELALDLDAAIDELLAPANGHRLRARRHIELLPTPV